MQKITVDTIFNEYEKHIGHTSLATLRIKVKDHVEASKATILFAFADWLSARKKFTDLENGNMEDLIAEFCALRGLPEPKTQKNIAHKVTSALFRSATKIEKKMLQLLTKANGATVPREIFEKEIWGADYVVYYKNLDVHMYNLRKKIKQYKLYIELKSRGQWCLVDLH